MYSKNEYEQEGKKEEEKGEIIEECLVLNVHDDCIKEEDKRRDVPVPVVSMCVYL